jgi:hypothetical protein
MMVDLEIFQGRYNRKVVQVEVHITTGQLIDLNKKEDCSSLKKLKNSPTQSGQIAI